MRMFISLALALLVAGALAAWASAGTGRHRAARTAPASIAAIADASTSWAEFSSKVPDLRAALANEPSLARTAG
jgi:hypothetical protein